MFLETNRKIKAELLKGEVKLNLPKLQHAYQGQFFPWLLSILPPHLGQPIPKPAKEKSQENNKDHEKDRERNYNN